MKKILIATKNQGKVKDFQGIFEKYGIEVISLLDLDDPIDDIEETGETFAENAMIKAETISNMKQLPVLADDSGLSIDHLNGRPGVYSARYAGMDKNDQENNQKVLKELQGVANTSRSAQFICAIVLAIPGEKMIVKEGVCKGTIALAPRGKNGFGYDPIFIPEGYDLTMAQLASDEKNAISHRAHAIRELMAWLESEKKVGF